MWLLLNGAIGALGWFYEAGKPRKGGGCEEGRGIGGKGEQNEGGAKSRGGGRGKAHRFLLEPMPRPRLERESRLPVLPVCFMDGAPSTEACLPEDKPPKEEGEEGV